MRRVLSLVTALVCLSLVTPQVPEGQERPTLSLDLQGHRRPGDRLRVIVQAKGAALGSLRGTSVVRRDLHAALALEVTPEELGRLAADPAIAHISGDLQVSPDMAVTNTVTRASSVWQGTGGLLGLLGTAGYTGSAVTVAVVDSGIAPHSAVGERVVARANFVSFEPSTTGDPFGHGTHVAGTIGGSRTAASRVTTAYSGGGAPAVRFVDVRVLGKEGVGYTSDVIAGIDWVVANRSRYDIRILNLSLGHPVVEPSAIDPLCRAVERAVQAGVVVVASAGNYGRTSEGALVLGGITSPGNSPHAITVGATDTRGTVDRRDDTIAAYSSRGPTRYDFAVKPDVVAPGTRIVSLESTSNYLVRTYPSWHVAGSGKNAYMRLSGTSMATAVVSGGAALLLDANPRLSPSQIKLALQMGARFMPEGGLIAGGAGAVDFSSSVKLSQSGLVPTVLQTLDGLLGTSSGAAYRDAGRMIDGIYDRGGVRLLGLLDLGFLWQHASDAEWGVLQLAGLSNPMGNTPANYLVWGTVAEWSSSYYLVWGTTIQDPSGQYLVWGTGDFTSGNYLVWGTADAGTPSGGRQR
jgi:serine protease AprX